jgi:hypothetical protein
VSCPAPSDRPAVVLEVVLEAPLAPLIIETALANEKPDDTPDEEFPVEFCP